MRLRALLTSPLNTENRTFESLFDGRLNVYGFTAHNRISFQRWTKFEGTKAARCSFYRAVLENRRGSVNSGQRPMRCAPAALALRQQAPVPRRPTRGALGDQVLL